MQVSRPDIFKEIKRSPKKLWLDKNENINQELLNFVKKNTKLTKEILSSYPNLSSTYKKIANFYKVNKYSLLLAHGSDGGIQNVFQALVKKNSHVILSSPTFAMYNVYAKAFDAKISYVKYSLNNKGLLSLDVKNLLSLLKKKPKLFCLPNPDSPTGSSLNNKLLEKIFKICEKNNCYILIDEAYHLFYKSSQIKKINTYKKLIVVKSFSKAFGLAGLRAGCIIANINTINYLKSFKQMYEINHFCSEVLNNIFTKKGISIIQKSINDKIDGKKLFLTFLKESNFEYLESDGNFIHVNFGINKKKIINELKKICHFRENDILLPVKGYSRFTLTNIKNFKKIINTINKYI
jgi:histidinol-phosphate aminotransferase